MKLFALQASHNHIITATYRRRLKTTKASLPAFESTLQDTVWASQDKVFLFVTTLFRRKRLSWFVRKASSMLSLADGVCFNPSLRQSWSIKVAYLLLCHTPIHLHFLRPLLLEMPNINKAVPGAKEFYALNEPGVGATLPSVRPGATEIVSLYHCSIDLKIPFISDL